MAEVVSEIPMRARFSKYPWSEWLNGSLWKLTPGVDFSIKRETFRTLCHISAKSAGKTVISRFVDGCLYIQATNNKKR